MSEIAPVTQNGVISTQVEQVQRPAVEDRAPAPVSDSPPPPPADSGRGETVDVTA